MPIASDERGRSRLATLGVSGTETGFDETEAEAESGPGVKTGVASDWRREMLEGTAFRTRLVDGVAPPTPVTPYRLLT